jgi:hypothetical protein
MTVDSQPTPPFTRGIAGSERRRQEQQLVSVLGRRLDLLGHRQEVRYAQLTSKVRVLVTDVSLDLFDDFFVRGSLNEFPALALDRLSHTQPPLAPAASVLQPPGRYTMHVTMGRDQASPDSQADRIQLCGRLVAIVGGRRLDESLTRRDERILTS